MQAAMVAQTHTDSPPSISEEAASQAVGLTEQHEQEVDDSDNSLLCHGVQWKVVDGVLEDVLEMHAKIWSTHLVGK